MGKVKLFDGSIEVKSTGQSTSEDFTAPIPMLGLNLHLGLLADILEGRVLVTGVGYGDGAILDSQADISWTPFPLIDIHGGYRLFTIDLETDDVEVNYSTSGPYVAITVSF